MIFINMKQLILALVLLTSLVGRSQTVNMMGQEVDQYATGVLFEMYTDGTSRKIIR
jgi:hypothetical protein